MGGRDINDASSSKSNEKEKSSTTNLFLLSR
jgi:hypothetical protein